jgi:hypothetical protein
LRLLPENTFSFVEDFQRGIPWCGEQDCGQIGIYARKEPLLGEKGIMLVVVNEHLFGDPTSSDDNPILNIPDGATNIYVVPPRSRPLKKSHPFAGAEFLYKGAKFFFGYELSNGAYSAIIESIKNRD